MKSGSTQPKPKPARFKPPKPTQPEKKPSHLSYLQLKLARLKLSKGEKHGLISCKPRTKRVHEDRRGRRVIEIDCLNIVTCHKWAIVRKAFDILSWWVDACQPICRCGPYDRDLHSVEVKKSGEKILRPNGKGSEKKWTLGPLIRGWR